MKLHGFFVTITISTPSHPDMCESSKHNPTNTDLMRLVDWHEDITLRGEWLEEWDKATVKFTVQAAPPLRPLSHSRIL